MNVQEQPGLYFVLATVLPLVSFVLLLLGSALWALARRYRHLAAVEPLYRVLGGDTPGRTPAFVALAAIALAFVCSLAGAVTFYAEEGRYLHEREQLEDDLHAVERQRAAATDKEQKEQLEDEVQARHDAVAARDNAWQKRRAEAWKGTLFTLLELRGERRYYASERPAGADPAVEKKLIRPGDRPQGTVIDIGYAIDSLAVVMFVMVTFIATLIHLFSIGYMSDELAPTVEDHQVHTATGALHRRGRFGIFFLYLSLFCFSMLNLVLADNLFQVFVSWELVGICSFLLIGFYYERQSASNAANKAFITNRIGDAGFILGLLIVWGYLGTFHFESIFNRLRSPVRDTHGDLVLAGKIVRAAPVDATPAKPGERSLKITLPGETPGSEAVLFPRRLGGHFHGLGPRGGHGHGAVDEEDTEEPELDVRAKADPGPREYSSMPYWMLVAAGLGIFLGCVGKSAQFPLQVWLPDAMEGPTPVSALIHAATMVAAGVYLVGRCYPLFTAEVLLVIAYTGAITLFVAATVALVMTDIKKVLAYSTVSQLGYMMLALGVGGWVAGLFHLLTHAFFKALLFLGSGSVIHGCHHEQDMTRMGGLYAKMKVTAITMLAGVLAIAGVPLFSGWYSKDSILAQAIGFVYVHPQHLLLFLLPLATAGLTTFYMFRMWFLTFAGEPRDAHVHQHAHESPWPMTVPLVLLAGCSVAVAWGWPLWDAKSSWLEHTIHRAQPVSVLADYGHVADHHEPWPEAAAKLERHSERHWAHELHDHAGLLALGLVLVGLLFALATYYYRVLDPAEAGEQFPRVHALLANKWYFDDLYSVLLVRPALVVARAFRRVDAEGIDGAVHGVARATVGVARGHGRFDQRVIDWLVNLTGDCVYAAGGWLRTLQTGSLRSYVLFLVLAAAGLFVLLSYFVAMATAG